MLCRGTACRAPTMSCQTDPFHPAINHWAILGNPYGIEKASQRDSMTIALRFNAGLGCAIGTVRRVAIQPEKTLRE